MNKVTISIIVAILVVLGLGITFSVAQKQADNVIPLDPVANEPSDEPSAPLRTITAQHQFKDGVHTVAGNIDVPTPCHILDHTITVAESFPEQVTILFETRSEAEACAQVITPARFKVEFEVDERATIAARLNGEPVILNLVEVNEGEDLEKFEVFIKG